MIREHNDEKLQAVLHAKLPANQHANLQADLPPPKNSAPS
jgi:hypothetical protein